MAWLFQDHRQKKKHGGKTAWSVGWVDPEGRRRSKRIGSHSLAEKFQRKVEGQLAAGTYETSDRVSWQKFRAEWEARIGSAQPITRRVASSTNTTPTAPTRVSSEVS